MEQSPQKPHHEPRSHFLASLTPQIPSSGILKSFPQEQTQGPELQEAPRPRRAMPVLSPSTRRGSVLHNTWTSRKKPLELPQAPCNDAGSCTAPGTAWLQGMQGLSQSDEALSFLV